MIFLPGGPPHQDMYDLKPDAPAEVRGEFKPIKTNVPGIEICEQMPRLAGMMDKLVPIRSMVGATGDHYSFQCMTGRSHQPAAAGGWPEFGSIVVKRARRRPRRRCRPSSACRRKMQHIAVQLGQARLSGSGLCPVSAQRRRQGRPGAARRHARTAGRSQALVPRLRQFQSHADATGMMHGMDAFQQQAFGVLTSSRLAEALDVGTGARRRCAIATATARAQHQGDGAPRLMQQFLMARRLVEAGVRCVTLSFSFWDYHGSNFALARQNLPSWIKASRPWSTTCTSAAWTKT